jgi:hypothetical protein
VRRTTASVLLFIFFCSVISLAQDVEPEVTIWGGGSVANGHVFGFNQDRRLIIAGSSAAYPIRKGRFPIFYKVEAVPLAVLVEPTVTLRNGHKGSDQTISTYGGGFNPVGAQMKFPGWKKLQPFAETAGGFLYFSRPVLNPLASQFNFTIGAGAGVEWQIKPRMALTLGYKYHHLSNANITNKNPGVDSQILYLGTTFRRHRLFF